MLTAEGCASRRGRLWVELASTCDVLVVGDPSHLNYFAGYAPSPFVFRTVESGALLLLEPERATLVADNLLQPFLDRAFADEVVAPTWYEAKTHAPHRGGMLVASALGRLATMPGRRVGVELAGVGFALDGEVRAGDDADGLSLEAHRVGQPKRRDERERDVEVGVLAPHVVRRTAEVQRCQGMILRDRLEAVQPRHAVAEIDEI